MTTSGTQEVRRGWGCYCQNHENPVQVDLNAILRIFAVLVVTLRQVGNNPSQPYPCQPVGANPGGT